MCENILDKSIENIKGVGSARLKQFSVLGVKSIYDIITYYPRAYEDRSVIKNIDHLEEGDNCSFIGTVAPSINTIKARKLTIYRVRVLGKNGYITAVFYNKHYIKDVLIPGRVFVFYGRIERDGTRLQVKDPEFSPYNKNKLDKIASITPIYNLTHGLSQNVIRGVIARGVDIGLRYIHCVLWWFKRI